MTETVTEKDCQKCKEGTQRQLDEIKRVTEKRLDAHAEQGDSLHLLIVEIKTLQKIQIDQLAVAESRLRLAEDQAIKTEERLVVVEAALCEQKAKAANGKDALCTIDLTRVGPVWKEPWFKYIVITSCIVVVIILGAALGRDVMQDYIEILKVTK